MRLTTKGRYAIAVMLDLALHTQQGPTSLTDISGRRSTSLSYLEQLFTRLHRGNLVTSVCGPSGGYQLFRHMSGIHMVQMIDTVNGSISATRCQGQGDRHSGGTCLTHHLWYDLSLQIHEFLGGISPADLVSRQEVQEAALRQDERCRSGRTPRPDKIEVSAID